MKILNVAEKNEAAKGIAEILSGGRMQRREGLSKFNKIYEFPLSIFGQNCTMTMTSVSGHLLNYAFPPSFKSWHSTDPLLLFDAPVSKTVIENGDAIKKTIQREVRNCRKLIIWTDCDREGENIGIEIVDVCKEVTPNIEIFRARFSEITPAAIRRAINQLTVPDYRASEAVDARQELDLRIGAAFTRFQTLRLRRVFPRALSDQLISYGSCQFPTLGFVVERFREVDRFIPEPFWRIVVSVTRDGKTADFQWSRGRLFDQDCCQAYYEHLLQNRHGQIIEVTKRPKSRWRPVALDTVELEKLASRKLKMGAKAAMQLAERLYTQGYISYPRTETNIFPPDLDLTSLVRVQTQDNRWSDFASRVLEHGPNPRNGKSTDKAHPPIHPLKCGSHLQGEEGRLYELVARHFLACLSADAQGAETLVRLCIGKPSAPVAQMQSNYRMSPEDGEIFESKGLVILMPNYLEVYIYDRWTERDMPCFNAWEWILPTNIEMLTGQTTPPPLLTEADLISLMDRHGIGTDATHAEHIETIKQRLYVGLEQNKFLVPGQLGMGLVEGYDAMGFEMSKPHLRAELEADLKSICEGRKTKEEVLRYHLDKYKNLFQMAIIQAALLDRALSVRLEQEAENVGVMSGSLGEMVSLSNAGVHDSGQPSSINLPVCACPTCGREMVLRQRRSSTVPLTESSANMSDLNDHSSSSSGSGWFLSCTGYPQCRSAIWFPDSIVHVRVSPGPTNNQSDKYCSRCSSYTPSANRTPDASRTGPAKLGLKFRRNFRLPNGYYQDDDTREYVTCIFCDEDLRTALGLRIPSSNLTNPPQSDPTARSTNQLVMSPPTSVARVRPNALSQQGTNLTNTRGRTDPLSGHITLSPQSIPVQSFSSSAPINSSGLSGLWSDDEDHSNEVVCNCGKQAILLTVKKAGPNQGRLFYRCGENSGTGCDFFLWKTSNAPSFAANNVLAASTQISNDGQQLSSPHANNFPARNSTDPWRGFTNDPRSNNSKSPWVGSSSSGIGGSSNSSSEVFCRCGEPAKLLKVTKPTPNQGREFYACPNGRPGPDGSSGSGCNFFQWADTVAPDSSGWNQPRNQQSYTGRSNRRGGRSNSQSGLVNHEDSVSVGHVPVWPPPASTGLRGTNFRSGSNRGRASGSGTSRRCGLCGEPGHIRTRCPQAMNQD